MRAHWDAQYLDGETPQARPARVRVLKSGLEISVAGQATAFWPYAQVRQTQGRYAGEQVRLERGKSDTPELLLLDEQAFLADVRDIAGSGAGFADPRGASRRRLWTALAAVLAAAALAGVYCWGIPGLASIVAPHVPARWEAALGDAVLPHLAPEGRRCSVPALDQAIEALVGRLTASLGPTPYAFRVVVVRDPQVNAWALPGGRVVLLTGLLQGTGSPEELAGVLAHELQHAVRRHATRALLEHASAGLLLAAVTGDVTGVLGYGVDAAQRVALLRYSRRNEEEADEGGLRMLIAARIDPGGMLAFLERLEAREARVRVPAYLSTHPDSAARIARLRKEAERHRFPPLTPDAERWAQLRDACR